MTANRGSLENTDTEIMQDIESTIRGIYTTIMENDDIGDLEYLEKESKGFKTVNSEEKDFKRRKTRISKSNIANYKGLTLVEPIQESGVFAIVVQLMVIEPNLFPFQIVDYDTHSGIDVIAKEKNLLDIESSTLYYVEFKYILTKEFNHSFEYLYSIICWDTEIKDGGEVEDLKGNKRTLKIVPVNIKSNYKKYYLDDPNSIRKIEIFVLKDYLKDKLNIEFRPRIINMDKINK